MAYEDYDPMRFSKDHTGRQQVFGTEQALAASPIDTEAILAERTRLLSLSATVATALAGSDSLRAILQRCAEALVQHLNVAVACLWTLEAEEKRLALQASAGIDTPIGDLDSTVHVGDATIGGIARQRQAYVSNRVADDIRLPDGMWLQRASIRAFAGYPLIVEDRLVGVMAMFATQPFSAGTLKTLAWMAGVIAMGIDRLCISDALARSIAKVVRMNKSLRRKNAQLDEFTYLASHDLQEPLRKLMAFSSLLQKDLDGKLPPRARTDLGFIVEAATRMQVLLQALLDLSRTGSTAMHCSEVALDVCVDHALQRLAEPITAAGATIIRARLPQVYGDQALLTQLYHHLLSNALKFHGSRPPVIRLTVEPQGEQRVFGVWDNGIGIQPQYQEQIFVPFKRLHGRGEFEGTGIGLAICQKVVERHGGRLWVESMADRGACFKFTLASSPQTR